LKKDAAVSDTKNVGNGESKASAPSESAPPAAKSKVMDNVGLSRDMMNKLAKEMLEGKE
jgi:flagellar basal-body rod modification protein FlgD